MLNVHDLERRWLKYKIKSFIPYIISAIIICIGMLFLINFALQSSPENDEIKKVEPVAATAIPMVNTTKPAPAQAVIEEPIDVPQNTQEVIIHEEKTLVLKPSLHFMDNIEEGLSPYVQEQDFSDEVVSPSTNEEITTDTEATKQTSPDKPKVKSGLKISKQKNKDDLKDVIRRFKKNKNPALSLFIAKRYYELKQYQKSYNYALMTNEIDKNIDESWIIFSKSLVKLGQHELAIATLKSYLKGTKSTQAEILLRKIESGSFK